MEKQGHFIKSGLVVIVFLLTQSVAFANEESKEKKYPKEFDEAIALEPDLENGKKLYKACISCHGPEGWGKHTGSYPQIAGQLKNVIIKQLADFRAGNRDNPIMRAFSSRRALGNAQDIADVSGYIAQLPMTRDNNKGPKYLPADGAAIYKKMCANCHGAEGEGEPVDHGPALYGQHYTYLLRQFEWIRNGQRRNADKKMTRQIRDIHTRDEISVLAYTAQITPPEEKLAPEGWSNPDFPSFDRSSYNRTFNLPERPGRAKR